MHTQDKWEDGLYIEGFLVSSVMYAMICTRLKLVYAMSLMSRYMENQGKLHWEAMKWIFIYLKRNIWSWFIIFKAWWHIGNVIGFVDWDYATCLDSRRYITTKVRLTTLTIVLKISQETYHFVSTKKLSLFRLILH